MNERSAPANRIEIGTWGRVLVIRGFARGIALHPGVLVVFDPGCQTPPRTPMFDR